MTKERDTKAKNITIVQSLDEIPEFASEAEERDYWGTHALSAKLWTRLPAPSDDELPPPRPCTRSIAIRFDDATLKRVEALATRRNTGYQTLIKEFVIERLYEEEKRDGVVGR